MTAVVDAAGVRTDPGAPRAAATPDRDAAGGTTRRAGRDLSGPVVLTMSLGVLLLAVCVRRGLAGDDALATDTLYWVAQGLVVAPAAWRVLTPGVSTRERTTVVLALGLLVQLGRTVLWPTGFAFHDELVHGNLLRLVLATHDAFPVNSVLPVTSSYPGLELASAAVVSLTGLSPHTSGVLVLLLARVVLVLAVRGVVSAITGSATAGCVAVLVYACNPQFVFFNSQFSYQTLALPLGLLAVHLVLTRGTGRGRLLAPLATLLALAVSHHLTSFLFTGALAAWWLGELVLGRHRAADPVADPAVDPSADPTGGPARRGTTRDLGVLAAAAVAAALVVALRAGNPVGSYLTAIADLSASNVQALSEGKQPRTIFADPAGVPTPDWERGLLVVALGLTTVGVLAALMRGRPWLRARNVAAILLLVAALGWPLVPAGHLTEATSEVTDRAAGFVFVGVAFAVAAARLLLPRAARWRRPTRAGVRGALVVAVVATYTGNTVLGIGPVWARVPGPFLVSADNRSIDAANLAGARWLAATQEPGSVLFGDRVSGLLAALIGRQTTLRHVGSGIDASPLLLQTGFSAADRELIRRAHVRWVVVDTRDSTGLPHLGVYVENGEYLTGTRTAPVPAAALDKLSRVAGVRRVYDNGAIVVYDVGALDTPATGARPGPAPTSPVPTPAPTAPPTPRDTPSPTPTGPLLTIVPEGTDGRTP